MSTMTAEARTAASTVDPTTAALIEQTRALLSAANAAGNGHDWQQPGHLYGDAHTTLLNLLTVAYGPVDGPTILDGMIESGESAAYIAPQIEAARANPVTRQDAEAVLAAIKHQFRTYLEPLDLPAEGGSPAMHLDPCCPEPTLVEWDDNAPWAIVWEDGPDEWAYRVTEGGTSEEQRVLAADAAREFGADPTAVVASLRGVEPATIPASVYVEPVTSFILALYPA